MLDNILRDPFGHFGNMPEVPENEDDHYPNDEGARLAATVFGCMSTVVIMFVIAIIIAIVQQLVK